MIKYILYFLLPLSVSASNSRILTGDVLQSSNLANTYTINYSALNAIGAGTTLQYVRGDGTLATLNTLIVPELTNLYFTPTRAQGAVSASAPLVDTVGVFSIPVSTNSVDGYLSAADHTTFAAKQSALTPGAVSTTTSGVTVGSGANSTVGPNVTVDITTADGTHNGLLSSSDWTTFNGKANLSAVWLKAGNAGTTAGTDFLGTTDATDLVFKTDSVELMRLNDAQKTVNITGGIVSSKSVTDSGESGDIIGITSHTTVDGSNTIIGINGNALEVVDVGATNDKSVLGMNFVVTRGNGSDDGTLHEMDGLVTLGFLNSGAAGVTDVGYGFQNTFFTQQGTLTSYYDFRSQVVPAGTGVITTHYGIYLDYDSASPQKNWLSGSTIIGGTSFSPPNNTLEVKGSVGLTGTIAGAGGNYTSMPIQQTVTAPVAGGYQGIYNSDVFQSSITNAYTAFGSAEAFQSGSSATGYFGFYANPAIQSGSTMGNMTMFEGNAAIDAGTMLGVVFRGAFVHPNAASDMASYNGFTNGPLLSGALSGGYTGFWEAPTFASGFSVSSAQGNSLTPQFQSGSSLTTYLGFASGSSVQSGSTVSNNTDFKASPSFAAGATITNGQSFQGAPTLNADMSSYAGFSSQANGSGNITNYTDIQANSSNSGAITNYAGVSVNPNLTGTVTNLSGIDVNITNTADQITGGKFDVSGATALVGRKIALTAGGGGISLNAGSIEAVSNDPQLVDSGNLFTSNFHVASGTPITGTDFIGDNLSGLSLFEDSMGTSAFGLGYVSVGFAGQVSVKTGKTLDKYTAAIAGGSYPAASNGGTITDAYMYRALGLVNGGGSLNVTNAYGFYADNAVGGFSATNNWGFFENGAMENYMSKLAIGTSSKKVTNSDTALEIGNNKAFLNGRGTTVQKNALTALAGMQFFDTDLNELDWYDGASWVSAGGGGGSGTVTSVALSDASSTPIFSISGSPVTTSGTLTETLSTQAANKVFSGPTSGGAAQPTFRSLVAADIPSLPYGTGTVTSVAATVPAAFSISGSPITTSGTLAITYSGAAIPISSGGTNSTTALNNNRVMQSSGGAIVEAAAITANRALISEANGIPTQSATTATELGYVSGVTSAIQTQLNGKQAASTYAQETPSGTVNNSNVTFTLAHTPVSSASVALSGDNGPLKQGTDYTISSATITMTTAPNFGQTLYATYSY